MHNDTISLFTEYSCVVDPSMVLVGNINIDDSSLLTNGRDGAVCISDVEQVCSGSLYGIGWQY